MKRTLVVIILILIAQEISSQEKTIIRYSGEYFGQKPPGEIPELFAPGIASTKLDDLNSVFFPGGKEVITTVQIGDLKWAMLMMKEVDGIWTKPEVASFNEEYGGVDPHVSFDGNTIYFCSNKPREEENQPSNFDIWYVTRTENGWSEPVNMGYPINTKAHEFYPSLTRDGTMYFQSSRECGVVNSDIYNAKLEN